MSIRCNFLSDKVMTIKIGFFRPLSSVSATNRLYLPKPTL